MAIGNLKVYKTDKGFGFLKQDDGGPDIFVHIGALKKSGFAGEPTIGQRFQFDIEQAERGPRAANLTLI